MRFWFEATAPQNGDTVVTAAAAPHYYSVNVLLCMCSPNQAFDMMRSFSAPGAPYAEDGTHKVILAGGNPIRQTVDPRSRTITNVTLPGHFFGGQVQISVTYRNGVSSASIVGSGIGPHAELNQIFGPQIYRALAVGAFFALNSDVGTYP